MSPRPSPAEAPPRTLLFREEQRFRQWWIWLFVLAIAVLAWWAFVEQILLGRPFGTNPGPDWLVWVVLAVFGVGLPGFTWTLRLVVEVDPEGVTARFRPLFTRRIPLSDIQAHEVVTYRPLVHYGGWGIRFSRRHGRAWTVSGRRGVALELPDDRRLLLGSRRPEALNDALDAARLRGSST